MGPSHRGGLVFPEHHNISVQNEVSFYFVFIFLFFFFLF